MKNFSLTQSGNLTVIIGMIMLILKYFQINIAEEEIQILIGGVLAVAGVVVSWIGRYRAGGITLGGFRLPPFES